jgi:Predicted nucleotidyltransferase
MRILGIVVEYNPFHNGHIYHIQQAKKLIHPDYTIAVMSSSFVQRGEPAIIDKWTRSHLAVEFGVDLVIELPFVYACQSADYFAKGAMFLLNAIGVTDLCFGSEDGNIETFIDIAKMIDEHHLQYQSLIKEAMNQGFRYPDACNQALKSLFQKEVKTPNDLLGLSYVKEIYFHHYPIQPHCIKRTNDYHGKKLHPIASASAIRKAITQKEDISTCLPHNDYYQKDIYLLDDFFPFLKYQILTSTSDDLRKYHLVEEGLENKLIKQIIHCHSMEEFIQSLLSKRYTRPRIQRMLIHILMKNTKEDIQKTLELDYVRILAMNSHGKEYLHQIKKECPYTLLTNFSKHKHPALDIEYKATKLLSLIASKEIIHEEISHIPYIK